MSGWGGFIGGYGSHHSLFQQRRFEEQYHCYSVSVADKPHLEKGDKILLPPSAFDTLARLQVDYPMLFCLTSTVTNATGSTETKLTHCGVLEFTAEEGTCNIPFWMMQNLLITEGAVITVTNVSLPKATFVKLQPQSTDFLEISNPRAVLEHALRNFSCVTKGDIIQIPYNDKDYQFELKEVKPKDAACIIETDCNVDFDAPVGYVEPDYKKQSSNVSSVSGGCPSPSNSSMGVASSLGEVASAAASLTSGQTGHSFPSGGQTLNGTPVAAAGSTSTKMEVDDEESEVAVRIVDGNVVKNENIDTILSKKKLKHLADRTGSTGVQKNAAIPEMAPEIDYWVLNAGGGARLDGKKPAQLKDKDGNIVNEDELRERRREEAMRAAQRRAATTLSSTIPGTTSGGPQAAAAAAPVAPPTGPVSKRKTKVGGKYSRLKQTGAAFQGNAHTLK